MQLHSIINSFRAVLGINQRNLNYIYPNNPRKYFPVADDKALTKQYLCRYNIPVPDTYCIITSMGEINSYWDTICGLEEFVVKPCKGKAGGGIIVFSKQDNVWNSTSGEFYSGQELKKHMADIIFGVYSFGLWDKVLIERRVYQHKMFDDIFPKGVADIRVIMYKHAPVLAMSRIPTQQSHGKANLHQGAIGVSIDIMTGRMGKGYDRNNFFVTHPDTHIEFEGVLIPFWKEIMDICKRTSEVVPLKYIGADIVIDRDKGPMIMEINARPGLEIQNVNLQGLRKILENLNEKIS